MLKEAAASLIQQGVQAIVAACAFFNALIIFKPVISISFHTM